MAKLIKTIFAVADGEVYPRDIEAGEDCPPGLEAYALSIGAIEDEASAKAKAEADAKAAADAKAEADAKAAADAEAKAGKKAAEAK